MSLDPKTMHELEQFAALGVEVAATIAGYYHALVKNGISPEEALFLTADYQRILFNQPPREDREPYE